MHPRNGKTFAALLLTTAVAAQQRQSLTGMVTDNSGRPVAAAEVIFVEDDANLVGIDPIDQVVVKTDELGRFVAKVQRGVRYTGLATGPEHDGLAMVASPVRNLSCGDGAELKLTIAAHRRRIELPGLRTWGDLKDLRLELRLDSCPGYAVDMPIDEEARFELPPLAGVCDVVLTMSDRRELCRIGVPLDPAQAPQLFDPIAVAVEVVDAHNAPIEGARVAVQKVETDVNWSSGISRTVFRDGIVTTTDKEGRATLRSLPSGDPFASPPDSLVVSASKSGYAESASGWASQLPFVHWEIVPAHENRTIRLIMKEDQSQPAMHVKGLAGRAIEVFAVGNAVQQKAGMVLSYYVPRKYHVPIALDGTCDRPALPRGVTNVHVQLPPLDGKRFVTMPTHDSKLPTIDLADFEQMSLQVLDEQGGPATSAVVLLMPVRILEFDLENAPSVMLDRAGRAELMLQRGRWTLFAMTPTSWAMQDLESWSADQAVTLTLGPKPSVRVLVVDADGKPVAGARFRAGNSRVPPIAKGSASLLNELGWNMFAQQMSRPTTNADGEATLRFLPWPGAKPTAFAFVPDRPDRSEDFAVGAGDEVVTVQLRR